MEVGYEYKPVPCLRRIDVSMPKLSIRDAGLCRAPFITLVLYFKQSVF